MTVALETIVVQPHARTCCGNQLLQRMGKHPKVNDVCLRCGTHWHGQEDSVQKYARREWDALLEADFEAQRLPTCRRCANGAPSAEHNDCYWCGIDQQPGTKILQWGGDRCPSWLHNEPAQAAGRDSGQSSLQRLVGQHGGKE